MTNPLSEADVLIVGCGIAGLSAAVSALQSGLTVIMLERAPEAEFGGNSRWTEAYLRMKNDAEISDDFEEQFATNAGVNLDPIVVKAAAQPYADWPPFVKAHPFPDPELVSAFAENVPPTIAWLKSFGLQFAAQPNYMLTQNTTRIAAKGGGLAIIECLAARAKQLGATILYRTTAVDFRRNISGEIAGVMAVGGDGRRFEITANAVILASGGYQGSSEMMTHYIGPRARNIRPVARGGYYNKGEGIRMALKAGAAPAGDFASYHAEPVDPRSHQAEAVIFIFPYGILVNNLCERFLDEAPGTVDAHYDSITRAIAYQPDGICYVIFDRQVEAIPRWQAAIRSEIPAYQADSIAALAQQLEISPERLSATVAAYNAACPKDGAFNALAVDHLATTGLNPPKSNWSRAIMSPPFRAYPIIPTNCFTYGGVKVNTHAQVLDNDGKPIPYLYAAGETVGIYHQVYPGSTSVLRAAVFGRLAGLHAAAS